MKRYIALDLGLKRTGIALVDDNAKVATPLDTIKAEPTSQDFINQLKDLLLEWEPTGLIFGLPIDLKGREAVAANNVRELASKIYDKINLSDLEMYFQDERLTTAQSESLMKLSGAKAKDRAEIRDALAAATIAQAFVDSL